MPQPSPLVGALDYELISHCARAIDRREAWLRRHADVLVPLILGES